MAQDVDNSRPAANENLPSIQDVRTAVLHLVELAAAYESRGIEVALPHAANDADRRAFAKVEADDRRTLEKVVELLLKHLKRSRLEQRNAIIGAQIHALSEVYRDGTNLSAADLQKNIIDLLGLWKIEPTDEQLDELVKLRDGETGSIKELGGPIDAAKNALAKSVGLSEGTVASVRRRTPFMPLPRIAFGHWVMISKRNAYMGEHCEFDRNASMQHAGSLLSLREIDVTTGVVLDSTIERLTRELTTTDGLNHLVLSSSKAPQVIEFQEQFRRRWSERCRFYLALIEVCPDAIEKCLEEPSSLDKELRDSIRALIDARRNLDANAVDLAQQNMGLALWKSVIESGRDNLATLFGEPDGGGD